MIIQISKSIDPKTGYSWQEINLTKQHNIPVGSLVEIDNGCRLFVVYHTRDCDKTPLYYLSIDKNDTVKEREHFRNKAWYGGYTENSLTVI